MREFERLAIEHFERYPEMEARDLFKLLYQYAFGCEHMATELEEAVSKIETEHGEIKTGTPREVEPLGDYCRVGLACLDRGLSSRTLGRLFCLSAVSDESGEKKLAEGVGSLTSLSAAGLLPFCQRDLSAELYGWESAGFPPVRHSDKYREAYSPSYRVIARKYAAILPLLARIDSMLELGEVRLAIEGGSASGKSTLGRMLEDIYGCTLFHMDDFFLPPEMRTRERLEEPGGNVHRERFLSEVLMPLSRGETVEYRRFDCSRLEIMPPVKKLPGRLTVTEGAYSMHPELAGYYNLSVFMEVDPELQRRRILARNSPDIAARHFSSWIPMEDRYFQAFGIKGICDLVIVAE